jgi:gluconokinase
MLCVVMGVSGSGKTTVGKLLAERLGVPFAEGDTFHSADNIAKMAAGEPLTDDDRRPWLNAIAAWLDTRRTSGGVVTCSALRRAYRDRLRAGRTLRFVYLRGSKELLTERLGARRDHFFPNDLLDSQLAILEEPSSDEPVTTISIDKAPSAIVDAIVAQLPLRWKSRPSR